MTSSVQIANRALSKIGCARIIAFTDNTKEGRAINACFDFLRDVELRANRWSFSIKRAAIAADSAKPVYGFAARFLLPADCLRVLEVGKDYPGPDQSSFRNSNSSAYGVEGRYIQSNDSGPVYLRYIAQISDTSLWDACFSETMACRIAAEVCEELTASTAKKQAAWSEYGQSLHAARRANAIELPSQPIADDTWMLTRMRG